MPHYGDWETGPPTEPADGSETPFAPSVDTRGETRARAIRGAGIRDGAESENRPLACPTGLPCRLLFACPSAMMER